MKVYFGAMAMFLAATAMGVTVIAAEQALVSLGHGALVFALAMIVVWAGSTLVEKS